VARVAAPVTAHPLAAPLTAALAAHRDAVLQAPTGSGKSTVVPLVLLKEAWLAGRKLIMLEPRRLAARAVAARMAQQLGESVGDTVGYRMRMDTRVGARTRIEVVTEGVLTRMLQSDPALEGVGAVIFDEYHERSLQADTGLALALDARAALSAEFRILVMSATVDGEAVAALLDDGVVVEVPGRSFQVDVHYVGRGLPLLPPAERPGDLGELVRATASAVSSAVAEHFGDVLVFLPGVGEIRRVQEALAGTTLATHCRVLPLYGELKAEEQDAALQPAADGARRIVLATNVAETSVTIPGITVVVDTGLARRSSFDPNTGMSRLELERISRASADQRAGRAGRTAPGVALRLWSEGAHASLAAQTPAEIIDADLAPLALELARWGTQDAASLRWLDPPPAATLAQARELLRELGALGADGRISAEGRAMAELPVHPRLAHMLLRAASAGDGSGSGAADRSPLTLASQLGALLSERDVLRGNWRERDPDVRTRIEMLNPNAGGDHGLRRIRQQAERLAAHPALRSAGRSGAVHGTMARAAADAIVGAATGAAAAGPLLAWAFPDRIGQRREGAGGRYLLRNGRGASFAAPSSLAQSEFIVALELDDREREARISLAAPITRADIESHCAADIEEAETVAWDTRTGAVQAQRTRKLGALTLEERVIDNAAPERVTEAMLRGIRELGIAALPWDRDARDFQARAEFVRRLPGGAAGAQWPASDDASLLAALDGWLAPWLSGIKRRDHLARIPLLDALRARYTRPQLQQLEQLAPVSLTVPSGSRIHIDYGEAGGPSVAVRLQEVFGLAESPRIGGGGMPVTFKLLSPAQRPVQITRDLKGFWATSYFDVRKDLRGRYPRHHWPENPLEAQATRRAKPRGT
jgi:ATP-dependent helicase HrpB